MPSREGAQFPPCPELSSHPDHYMISSGTCDSQSETSYASLHRRRQIPSRLLDYDVRGGDDAGGDGGGGYGPGAAGIPLLEPGAQLRAMSTSGGAYLGPYEKSRQTTSVYLGLRGKIA